MCCISDVRDLELPKTCQIEFPDPDDLLNFKLNISPDEVQKSFIELYILIATKKLPKATALAHNSLCYCHQI